MIKIIYEIAYNAVTIFKVPLMKCFHLIYVEPLICVEIGPLSLDIMINSRKPEPGQDGDVLGNQTHLNR